jgi:hypothetical protein
VENDKILIEASRDGKIDIVQLLLNDDRVNPISYNKALIEASAGGNIRIFKLLYNDDRVDPSFENNKALIEAAKIGAFGIVSILLHDDRVDPSAGDNQLIISASMKGDIKLITQLLDIDQIDPSARNNQAILNAYIRYKRAVMAEWPRGNADLSFYIVKTLIEDFRVNPWESKLDSSFYQDSTFKDILTKKIINSLHGFVIGSGLNTKNFFLDKENIIVKLIKLLITTKYSLVVYIKKLQDMKKDNISRKNILYAASSVLKNGYLEYIHYPSFNSDIFFPIRGFLLMVYKPNYTFLDIVKQLYTEGMNQKAFRLVGGILGAYMGANSLIKQGLKIDPNMKTEINKPIDMELFII